MPELDVPAVLRRGLDARELNALTFAARGGMHMVYRELNFGSEEEASAFVEAAKRKAAQVVAQARAEQANGNGHRREPVRPVVDAALDVAGIPAEQAGMIRKGAGVAEPSEDGPPIASPAPDADFAAAGVGPAKPRTEQVLGYLREHGPTRQQDLGDALGMRAPHTSVVVASLRRSGRVERSGWERGSPVLSVPEEGVGRDVEQRGRGAGPGEDAEGEDAAAGRVGAVSREPDPDDGGASAGAAGGEAGEAAEDPAGSLTCVHCELPTDDGTDEHAACVERAAEEGIAEEEAREAGEAPTRALMFRIGTDARPRRRDDEGLPRSPIDLHFAYLALLFAHARRTGCPQHVYDRIEALIVDGPPRPADVGD